MSLRSLPVQTTLSSQICPLPAPKEAWDNATAPTISIIMILMFVYYYYYDHHYRFHLAEANIQDELRALCV
jgi:hypothetical protein